MIVKQVHMKYKGINLFKNFGNLSCSNYSSNGLSGWKSTKNLKDQQFEENVSSSSRNARLTRRQKMSLAFMEAFDELK